MNTTVYKEVVSSVFFCSVLSYLYWPSAGYFFACHFCLWGKIIHSLEALTKTWTWSWICRSGRCVSANDFSRLSRIVFGTTSYVYTGRQVRL